MDWLIDSTAFFPTELFQLRLDCSVTNMLVRSALATLLCFCLFSITLASSNDTIVTGWVDDPNGRGTFTIVSSCVLTLSLCVYTSMHLNVRPHGRTELQAWIETTKWVVFGILAPELLVYVAWRQYVSAMALDRIVRELQEKRPSEESPDQNSNVLKVRVTV